MLKNNSMHCLQSERWANTSWLWILVLLAAATTGWAALFAAKLALGFALKRAAAAYVDHYDSHSKSRWAHLLWTLSLVQRIVLSRWRR